MRLEKLIIKNLLSYGGGKEQVYDFSKPGIDLIIGTNGIGKSNMNRIIKMCLYFDYPSNIEKIVNFRAAGGSAKFFIKKGEDKYRLEYVFSRKKFKSLKVFKNANPDPEDTGNVTSSKKWVNEHIIDIPKDVFYNVYAPSIDVFKSFIGMRVEDSRKIRDELFSLTPINIKRKLASDTFNSLTREIEILETKIETNTGNKIELENKIEETKKSLVANKKEALSTAKEKLEKLENDSSNNKISIAKLEEELFVFNKCVDHWDKKVNWDKLQVLEKEKAELLEKIADCRTKVESYNKIIDGYNQLEKVVEEKELRKKILVESSLVESDGMLLETITGNLLDIMNDELMSSKIERNREKELLIEEIARINTVLKIQSEEMTKTSQENVVLKAEHAVVLKELGIYELGEGVCPTCESKLNYDSNKHKLKKDQLNAIVLKNKALGTRHKMFSDTHQNAVMKLEMETRKLEACKLKLSELPEHIGSPTQDVSGLNKIDEENKETEIKNRILETESLLKANTSRLNILSEELKDSDIKDVNDISGAPLNDKQWYIDKRSELNNMGNKHNARGTEINVDMVECKKLSTNYDPTHQPTHTLDVSHKEILIREGALKACAITTKLVEDSIVSSKTTIKNLEENDATKMLAPLEKSLAASVDTIKSLGCEKNVKSTTCEKYDMLKYVYSEDGMKKWVLNKIKQDFAKKINESLSEFALKIEFDDNFAVTIYKGGDELPDTLLSVGQKKIIDTITCIEFILLYARKIKDTNFCSMDECLSNLTKENAEKLLVIMRNKLVARGFNIKLTNHSALNQNFFRETVELIDRYGYTQIKTD